MVESEVIDTLRKKGFIPLLSLGIVLVLACASSSRSLPQASAVQDPVQPLYRQPSVTTIAPPDPVIDGWLKGASARAWRAVSQNGRYGWAGETDFRFPDWAKQRYSADLQRAIRTPVQAGHIKGSYKSKEVALIVVDTTRRDWNRYSVVIFSEESMRPQRCEVRWLLQNRDLSRVQLGWSSGDTLGITEYAEDGSYRHCFVKWVAKKQAYKCNLTKIK